MKPSPAILITTPPSPVSTRFPSAPQVIEQQPVKDAQVMTPSASVGDRSPEATRLSFLNVDSDSHRRLRQHLGGGMAAIRRHTLMLARDVLLRRFSRNEPSSSEIRQRMTLEEFERLVHEVNHTVASYRQILQSIGTPSESRHARKELTTYRHQCLRQCDTSKNCIIPLLKEDTEVSQEIKKISETARHACHQFIGCLNMFINEMKRSQNLLGTLPNNQDHHTVAASALDAVTDASSYVTAAGSTQDIKADDETETLSKDLKDAEEMLESLENAITIHFAIDSSRNTGTLHVGPKTKRNCWKYDKFCLCFRTNYA